LWITATGMLFCWTRCWQSIASNSDELASAITQLDGKWRIAHLVSALQ